MSPHYRKSFPSRFLQSADLDDGPLDVTIEQLAHENLGSKDEPENKLVAKFAGDTKPLVLNLTRAESIADLVGDDNTDSWVGTRIRLGKGRTTYMGKRVACIDVLESPIVGEGEAATDDVPALTDEDLNEVPV